MNTYHRNSLHYSPLRPAILLTLLVLIIPWAGCSPWRKLFSTPEIICNNHAYVRQPLQEYLTARFNKNSPARLGIIPFTVPANLTSSMQNPRGLDNDLAHSLHATLLDYESIPIVEVLPREDWPGKAQEFFTGNYIALTMAREAGYDLAIVGLIEPLTSMDTISAYTKLLDTDNGMTIWYGKTTVKSEYLFTQDTPAKLANTQLWDEVTRCAARGIMRED